MRELANTEHGWPEIVGAIAADNWPSERDRELYALIDQRLRAAEPDLWQDISRATTETLTAALFWAAAVGYALARTWPDRFKDFDDWARRVLDYAKGATDDE